MYYLFISPLGLEPNEPSSSEGSFFASLSRSDEPENCIGNAVYKCVGVLLLRDVVEKGV